MGPLRLPLLANLYVRQKDVPRLPKEYGWKFRTKLTLAVDRALSWPAWPNADVWDWQLHAACRGMASSYFFHPEGERGPARARREATAKAVCHDCPAMAACRAHALEVHEPYGIWGGLSEGERQQLIATSVQAG